MAEPTTTETASEDAAWCTIVGTRGRMVRTNSYTDYAEGARFVTTLDEHGHTLGHYLSEAWSNRLSAETTMAALWSDVADETTQDPEYGTELTWNLGAGQLRACPHGSYVRLLDGDGKELDGGSAHWTSDEWVEDAELVMGAILGAANTLET